MGDVAFCDDGHGHTVVSENFSQERNVRRPQVEKRTAMSMLVRDEVGTPTMLRLHKLVFARLRGRRYRVRLVGCPQAQFLPSLLAITSSTFRLPLDMWSKSFSSFFAGLVKPTWSGSLAGLGSPELWNKS